MISFSVSVRLPFILASGLLAACTGLHPPQSTETDTKTVEYQRCADFFSAFDHAVSVEKGRDAQSAAIAGFPYLRADRLLALFGGKAMDHEAFETWVDRLQQLDARARKFELNNLPLKARRKLARSPSGSVEEEVRHCGQVLRQLDMATHTGRQRLLEAVQVPDEYQTARRVVGLYPLTSIVVAQTIRAWHDKTRQTFDQSLAELPVHGELVRYVPPGARPVAPEQTSTLIEASNDLLGVPHPQGEDLERLFAAFAPVWEVDVNSDNDLIGTPEWRSREEASAPQINTSRPAVYRHVSHTQFDGRILLQLNYVIWFPSRPRTGAFDILGGHLDGITWRVTLGPNGQPLIYDAMHNCGCYHMFFPTTELQARKRRSWSEPLLIPQAAPELLPGSRLVIRIAANTHYIQRVYAAAIGGQNRRYRFAEYDMLRSLPLPDGGHRSLFDANGIVASSRRGERWLIWPMGVPAPGSMRQWGHHAIAFIGRRHFDDPDLFDELFERVGRRLPTIFGN